MKKIGMIAVSLAVMICFTAAANAQVGKTKFAAMTRVESHSKIGKAGYPTPSGETFGYQMISASRQLQEGYMGTLFYLLRYNFDDSEISSHIAGANFTRIFNPYWVLNLGYSYSSSPEKFVLLNTGLLNPVVKVDSDRFAFTLIHNFNPKEKTGPKYSLTAGFSTVTDFGESQVVSAKPAMTFPIWKDRWRGELDYTYSYSTQADEQLTNQFGAKAVFKVNKKSKISLEGLYIDNTYTNNQGDDVVSRLSYNVNLR